MSIRDKFVYVTTKSQDQTCIGLTEKSGKYHGVVYKYGKVGFGEENLDGTKPLRFEYNIVDNNGLVRFEAKAPSMIPNNVKLQD